MVQLVVVVLGKKFVVAVEVDNVSVDIVMVAVVEIVDFCWLMECFPFLANFVELVVGWAGCTYGYSAPTLDKFYKLYFEFDH